MIKDLKLFQNKDGEQHPIMLDLLEKIYSYTYSMFVMCGGTSSGKTCSILQTLSIIACIEPNLKIECTSVNVPHIKSGILQDFQDYCEREPFIKQHISEFNKTDRKYIFKNGTTLSFPNFPNVHSATGKKRHILYINEITSFPEAIFNDLYNRTSLKNEKGFGGITIVDFNPSRKFYIQNKYYHKPTTYVQYSNIMQNIFLDDEQKKKIIEQNLAMGENRHRVYNLGLTGSVEENVFPADYYEVVDNFPNNVTFRYGLDFGFSISKTALVKCAYSDGYLYVESLIYDKGLLNHQLIKKMKQVLTDEPHISCDSASPQIIAEIVFSSKKFKNVEAVKKPKIIDSYNHLKSFKGIRIVNSPNILIEFENTVYKKDKITNVIDETTIDKVRFDPHSIDAIRYCIAKYYTMEMTNRKRRKKKNKSF